jgi:inorganic pyrophosphatase
VSCSYLKEVASGLVAVAEANHMYANVRRIKDLPKNWVEELEIFFVKLSQSGRQEISAARSKRGMRSSL